jgi:3'-phosphoadenosine 5'-phosphosulfate sulfotransferase (PAPS reductase)/FAD synthetase
MSTPRSIVAYSGGIASAYCIGLCPGAEVYFNDTLWEHDDLYRFNNDVARDFGVVITSDSDGRDCEQIFNDEHILGSNRVPVCSRILKAERLQRYAHAGDTIYFGIMPDELPRAARIRTIYTSLGINTEFPMIRNENAKADAFNYFDRAGIKKPYLYTKGFAHNNCSGGCVRGGKRNWARLWHSDKATYQARSDCEQRFNERFKTHYSFLRDCTLEELVPQIKRRRIYDFSDDGWQGECIGLCAVEKEVTIADAE